MRQLPHLQEMWETYRDRGLHFFHVESQHHSEENVEAFIRRRGVTFPNVILDWSDFPLTGFGAPFGWGYDCRRLPKTYIIGVDGSVIWEGRFGYDDVLKEELKKVRYPGLFKQQIAKELRSAARSFGAGKYAEALVEAEKILPRLKGEVAIEDANLIVRRSNEVAGLLRAEVEEAMSDRRYEIAIDRLKRLTTGFEGHQIGSLAAAEITELEGRADVKAELAAALDLHRLFQEAGSSRSGKEKLAAKLRSFAEKHAELRVAERALALLDGLDE